MCGGPPERGPRAPLQGGGFVDGNILYRLAKAGLAKTRQSSDCPTRGRILALPRSRFSRILKVMEVQLTPEQEAQLAQIATKAGTDAERLAKDAVLRLLEGDAGFRPVSPGRVVTEMRALRARVKPDPEGWTTRDYVNYGRR